MSAPQRDAFRQQLAVVGRQLWALVRELGRLGWLALARLAAALRLARRLGLRESARRIAVLTLAAASFGVAAALVFVAVSALTAAHLGSWLGRAAVGVVAVAALPLWARRRFAWPGLGTVCLALVLLVLVGGLGRSLGTALRRHGDWFLPRREHGAPAWLRARLLATGALLERFAPPPQMLTHALPPPPPFFGPWRPGEPPSAPEPEVARWLHPLVDPARPLPEFESRRFGAARPAPRPAECELGHCGVDLAAPAGAPVRAVADGIVEHVERDNAAGGRSGRFVRLGHLDGTVVTRYLHLDEVRPGLRAGARIGAGTLIGTVGRSGVDENFPHLHFGLSLRGPGGAELYVDPEPFLRVWD